MALVSKTYLASSWSIGCYYFAKFMPLRNLICSCLISGDGAHLPLSLAVSPRTNGERESEAIPSGAHFI